MKSKIKQFRYESDSWKRMLEFILLENTYCKNRLADVTGISTGKSEYMEEAEQYQDYFIQEETVIALLRNDLSDFDKLLAREIFEDGALLKEVMYNRKRLIREMDKLEQEFRKRKIQFNYFLEGNS